jgi:predicted heme/steroid binding protein
LHETTDERGYIMKRTAAVFFTLLLVCSLITVAGCSSTGSKSTSDTTLSGTNASMQEFTLAELATYDGMNGKPAYIAVDGVVYDVTNVKQWSDGTHQGYSAGLDLTDSIGKAPHGKSKLDGVPVVGTLIG